MKKKILLWVFVLGMLCLVGCGKAEETSAPVAEEDMAEEDALPQGSGYFEIDRDTVFETLSGAEWMSAYTLKTGDAIENKEADQVVISAFIFGAEGEESVVCTIQETKDGKMYSVDVSVNIDEMKEMDPKFLLAAEEVLAMLDPTIDFANFREEFLLDSLEEHFEVEDRGLMQVGSVLSNGYQRLSFTAR